MEKIPYEERVRHIAEEMAKKDYDTFLGSWDAVNELPKWEDQPDQYKSQPIQSKMSDAEVAVAKMAEAVRFFIDPVTPTQMADLNKRLTEYGLIPDKTGDRAVTR